MDSSNNQITPSKEQTPMFRQLACGTGHIMNDVNKQMVYSFTLIFYLKVAGLSGSESGLVLLVSGIANGLIGSVVGYCSDKVPVPLLSRYLGDRKAWHLIGVVLIGICLPLRFSQCRFCPEDASWSKVIYYMTFGIIGNIGVAAADIGHVSISRSVAKSKDEVISLSVLRTILTYLSGVGVLGVAWVVFRGVSGDDLSESVSHDFTILSCILVGIGFIFSGLVFQMFTKEQKAPKKNIVDSIAKSGVLAVGLIFSMGANYEGDDFGGETSQERKTSVPSRKSSALLRKISAFLVDTSQLEGHYPDQMTDFGGETSQERKTSVPSRKSSAVLRKISAFLVDTSQLEGHYPDQMTVSRKRNNLSNDSHTRESHFESIIEYDDVKAFARTNYGMEHQDDPRDEDEDKDKDCHYRDGHFNITEGIELETSQSEKEEKDGLGLKDKNRLKRTQFSVADVGNESSTKKDRTTKKSSFPGKVAAACHIEVLKEKTQKARIEWLKDPRFYKVTLIYTITTILQNTGNSYLPFYLTDNLGFEKEAIAYFALVLLASGIIGTALSKLLASKIGKKCTYCIAAAVVTGSGLWFYFLGGPRQMVYGPTVLTGIGISAMFAMTLSFIMDLIGENMATSGFVYSTLNVIGKVLNGVYFAVVQAFYPSNSGAGGECLTCGSFARLVLSLCLGAGSLLVFLIVAFDIIRTWFVCTRDETDSIDEPSDSEHSEDWPEDQESWDTRL